MATFKAADFGKKVVRMNDDGNGWNESYRYVYSTAIIAASVVQFGIIPAGVEVNGVKYVASDANSTVTAKLGFTPVNANDGPAANDAYWLAAGAAIGTVGTIHSLAAPILFEFPVILTVTTAAATAVANAVAWVVLNGKVVGIK